MAGRRGLLDSRLGCGAGVACNYARAGGQGIQGMAFYGGNLAWDAPRAVLLRFYFVPSGRPLRATSLLCVRVLLLEEGLLRKGPSFLFFALRVPLFSVPCLFAWDGRSFTAPCPLSTVTCT